MNLHKQENEDCKENEMKTLDKNVCFMVFCLMTYIYSSSTLRVLLPHQTNFFSVFFFSIKLLYTSFTTMIWSRLLSLIPGILISIHLVPLFPLKYCFSVWTVKKAESEESSEEDPKINIWKTKCEQKIMADDAILRENPLLRSSTCWVWFSYIETSLFLYSLSMERLLHSCFSSSSIFIYIQLTNFQSCELKSKK